MNKLRTAIKKGEKWILYYKQKNGQKVKEIWFNENLMKEYLDKETLEEMRVFFVMEELKRL